MHLKINIYEFYFIEFQVDDYEVFWRLCDGIFKCKRFILAQMTDASHLSLISDLFCLLSWLRTHVLPNIDKILDSKLCISTK
jgi:hypothetical protein